MNLFKGVQSHHLQEPSGADFGNLGLKYSATGSGASGKRLVQAVGEAGDRIG